MRIAVLREQVEALRQRLADNISSIHWGGGLVVAVILALLGSGIFVAFRASSELRAALKEELRATLRTELLDAVHDMFKWDIDRLREEVERSEANMSAFQADFYLRVGQPDTALLYQISAVESLHKSQTEFQIPDALQKLEGILLSARVMMPSTRAQLADVLAKLDPKHRMSIESITKMIESRQPPVGPPG